MSAKPTNSVKFVHSSFFRAALLVTLSAAVIVAAMSTLSFLSTQKIALDRLRDQAHGTSEIIAAQLVGAMRFADTMQLGKALKDVVDDEANPADAALAIDAKGEVLATYALEGVDVTPFKAFGDAAVAKGGEARSDDGLLLATPVRSATSDAVLGFVVTHWSDAATLAAIRDANFQSMMIALAVMLVSTTVTAFLFRAMIAQRLTRVNAAMSAIAEGALDTKVPYVTSRDEIGHIAKVLEEFRQSLQKADATNQLAEIRGTALASASTAIMLTSESHEITYVNAAMVNLMRQHATALRANAPDFDPDNLIGFRADRILEGSTQIASEMDQGLRQSLRIEQDLSSGTIVAEANPVIGSDGRKLGHVAEWHDITSARRNVAIITAIDATQLRVEFQPDGRLSNANVAMCMLLQSDESHLIDRDFSHAITVDATGEQAFDAIRRGETVIGRMTVSMDGTTLMLTGALAPVRNRSGAIQRVVMIASDMTDIEFRETQGRAEREQIAAAQRQVVDELRAALRHLAEGDLTQAIRDPFPGEYETLRLDYNDATSKLRDAMQMVLENSELIRSESGGISRAAEDLSRRTEQQAATLEETAAALNQLTASVKSAAERTLKANDMVAIARRNSESSGQVVREAVQAMGEISESSNKISKITSVIEEISFQTNLLALNAGVEAARAGEAGRGFAVVASEVRALAQRSSEAAREIAGLISDSAGQVKRGVDLVGQAGSALDGIQTSVSEIVTFMTDITASTTEQSAGLTEVNTAVLQLDQVTQHNAAMFEETTAASQSLAREADGLSDTMSRFQLGSKPGAGSKGFRSAQGASAPAPKAKPAEPAYAPPPPAAPSRGSSRAAAVAAKPAPSEDTWEDF